MDQLLSGNSVLGIRAWSPFPPLIIGLLRVPGRVSVQIYFLKFQPPTHHPCQDATPPRESTGVCVVVEGEVRAQL